MIKRMRKKIYLLTLLFLSICGVRAQYVAPSEGVFRIVNVEYNAAMTENFVNGKLQCAAIGDADDYEQMWALKKNGNYYTIQNVFTGAYIQTGNSGTEVPYWTGKDPKNFKIVENTNWGGYNIWDTGLNGSQGLHSKGGDGNIVRWTTESSKAASEWRFVSIDISEEEMAKARAAFAAFANAQNNEAAYQAALSSVFEDAACTVLKAEYAAKDDEALCSALTEMGLPAELVEMAVKVKNDSWGEPNEKDGKPAWGSEYGKKFRVQLIEPHSIAGEITEWFGYNAHTNMDNPTGIYANKCQVAYIMVEGEIKEGAELWATWIYGHSKMPNYNNGYSNGVRLKSGLNVVPFGVNGSAIYINYLVHTYNKSTKTFPRKLSEYDNLKVHIEGGYINSYYNAWGDELYAADTDADWEYYEERANLENITILGRYQVLQFNLNPVTENGATDRGLSALFPEELPSSLPENQRINAIVEAWDRIMLSELMTLGVARKTDVDAMNALYPRWDGKWENKAEMYNYEGYTEFCDGRDYGEYYNHRGLAFGVGGNSYMYGSWDHCGYHRNTTPSILTKIATEAGATWGPGHEIGHQHQGLFTVNGLTEVTNNLFANISVWYMGLGTSRLNGTQGSLTSVYENFRMGGDFFDNNIWALTQMYYRLWLYYHRAGNDTQFYPKLFELLRKNPMSKGYTQSGKTSILHFYQLCCDAAQEDLTEFFRAYGFFKVMNNRFVGDYSNSEYTQSQADIDKAIATVKAKGYPVNNKPIFINDATPDATYSHDGKTQRSFWDGNSTTSGSNAEIGSYLSYITPDAAISGKYLYELSDLKVKISGGEGAVGFAIYNKEGEIQAFSNHHSFVVTEAVDLAVKTGEATIVAVAPYGEDVTVLDKTIHGSEEEQYKALKASLADANDILELSDDQGAHVGYFKANYLEDLQTLVAEAQAAYDDKNVAVHGYGEWAVLLNQMILQLSEDDAAKVPLYADDYYALGSAYHKNNSLEYSTAGLKVTFSAPATNVKKQWQCVPSGEANQYYLLNVNSGLYVSTSSANVRVKALADNTDDAIAFNLIEAEPSRFYLQSVSTGLYLSCDGSKNVIASSSKSTNALWTLTSVADNHSEAMKADLELLLGMVDITLDELVAATEPELQLHADVTVLDEQLPTYVVALQNAVAAARKAIAENYAYLDAHYAAVSEAHTIVKAAYRKTLYLPEATTGDEVMCYYIQCVDKDSYAYRFETGRYDGAIRTGELVDMGDHNYWFYLRPGEAEGQYYIYNLETGKAAGASGRYIYVDGSADSVAYTITVSEDAYGYVISAGDSYWNVQGSINGYAQFTSKAALWNLIPIGRFSLGALGVEPVIQTEEQGIYYDLLGRPVENPSSGIYIRDGRKVIVK